MKLFAFLIVALGLSACGQADQKDNDKPALQTSAAEPAALTAPVAKHRLMLATLQTTPATQDIDAGKVDAALNAACELLDNYTLVPITVRDSLVHIIQNEGGEANAGTLAQRLNVDRLLFMRIDRVENILRVSMVARLGPDYEESAEGVGWALIRYRKEITNEQVYDPAILAAVQRALTGMEEQPSLFSNAPEPFNVRPAQPLAVGGIHFVPSTMQPKWTLFENKIVVSYNAVLTVIREAMKHPGSVVYDLDTRDTVYSRNNLYIVENYTPPSRLELKILEVFEVAKFIHGKVERDVRGAVVSLTLCTIRNGTCNAEKQVSRLIEEDAVKDLQEALQELTRELLGEH